MHLHRYCHTQRRCGICTSVIKANGKQAQNRTSQSPMIRIRHPAPSTFWRYLANLRTVVEAFDLKIATTLSYFPALQFCKNSFLVPEPYSYILVSPGSTYHAVFILSTFNCTIFERASQSCLACVIFPISKAACCVIFEARPHIRDCR
jgi:hypothetical protein